MAPAQAIPVGTGLSETQWLAGGEPEEQGSTSLAGLPLCVGGHGMVPVTAGDISLVGLVTGRAGNGGEGNDGKSVETLTRDVW